MESKEQELMGIQQKIFQVLRIKTQLDSRLVQGKQSLGNSANEEELVKEVLFVIAGMFSQERSMKKG